MKDILYRWLAAYLTRIGAICWLDMGNDAPAAPDYTATAAATEASARIMAEQGDRVLAESQRQYDKNMEVAKPVADAQLALMEQSKTQGDDYYNYMVAKQRPVEDALNAEAMAAGSTALQEEAANKAVADVRQGSTQQQNQLIRQGMRYGMSPAKIAATLGTQGNQVALAGASAANAAREKERTTGFAKKMDVAGMYRGLPGASQGAYNLAINSGTSAVGNTMAPGAQAQNASIAAAGIYGQGQQMRTQGALGILNAQTNAYATASRADESGFGAMLGGLGGLGQGLGAMGLKFGSSKKLKTRRRDAGPALKGIRNLKVDNWKYKDGVADGGEHTGPYAEDVQREFGDKAAPGGKMLDMISMQGIMLKAIQELDKKVDRVSIVAAKGVRGAVKQGNFRRAE